VESAILSQALQDNQVFAPRRFTGHRGDEILPGKIDEGFVDEPVAGCPASSRPVDPEQVGRIVQGVLAELKERGLA
jgi:hypothetical protein